MVLLNMPHDHAPAKMLTLDFTSNDGSDLSLFRGHTRMPTGARWALGSILFGPG